MSNAQDPYQVFDLDRDFIAPARTPPLEQVNPSFRVAWSPPPLGPHYPSSDSSSEDENREVRPSARRKIRKGRTNPSLTDGVLIRALDPNQPEAARHAEKYALASASQSEAEDQEDDEARSEQARMIIDNGTVKDEQSDVPEQPGALVEATSEAIQDTDGDFPMVDSPARFEHADRTPPEKVPREIRISCSRQQPSCSTPCKREHHPPRATDAATHPRPAQLASEGLRLQLGDNHWNPDDSIVTSPILGKYTITPQDPDPDVVLPAMQMSPARSSATPSPRQKQTLPSLRTHLPEFEARSPGFAGMSPILGRPSPGQWPPLGRSPPFHQSSHAGMSPPALPTHSIWRTTTRDSSISTSSEYTPGSSATVSTPASSIIVQSPAASANLHPMTPLQEQEQEEEEEEEEEQEKDTVAEHSPEHSKGQDSKVEVKVEFKLPLDLKPPKDKAQLDLLPPKDTVQLDLLPPKDKVQLDLLPPKDKVQLDLLPPKDKVQLDLTPPKDKVQLDLTPPKDEDKDPPIPNRVVPGGNYPCTHEGCTAIPFQTQYLLNSHMNVHSDTRTHFCPVEECPRGPGGLGFKRKNEMIR
ncbi:hypothetical protein H2202_002555 [Exophiala xenobiotica]|nr:hypothetical protein H2202_002555 [Exophiala xenobiotica]KAK5205103.1 hypothetical protein LTR41_009314 [Exophiala xenobiotica]